MNNNKYIDNKLGDWERLQLVIKWARMTTNHFAHHIGFTKAETLYRIKRGFNGLSDDVVNRVVECFPQINIVWLKMGFGEMFGCPGYNSHAKPLYRVESEEQVRNFHLSLSHEPMLFPLDIDYDFGMLYLGGIVGATNIVGATLFLKKIAPEAIIHGSECVIVTKKIVLLSIIKLDKLSGHRQYLQLTAPAADQYDDLTVDISDVEAAYLVKGKILIKR